MARYTGPKVKLTRRLGTNIFENDKGRKALERRPYPPGAHGRTRRRSSGSEYLVQLQEKQKAKYIAGVATIGCVCGDRDSVRRLCGHSFEPCSQNRVACNHLS